MATPTIARIQALRTAALRLETTAAVYRWSSYGQCNCGHLAQTVTGLSDRAIQQRAIQHEGDWGRHAATHPSPSWSAPRPDCGDRTALDEGAWEPRDQGACVETGTPIDDVLDRGPLRGAARRGRARSRGGVGSGLRGSAGHTLRGANG